jgi:hypothetical protein
MRALVHGDCGDASRGGPGSLVRPLLKGLATPRRTDCDAVTSAFFTDEYCAMRRICVVKENAKAGQLPWTNLRLSSGSMSFRNDATSVRELLCAVSA